MIDRALEALESLLENPQDNKVVVRGALNILKEAEEKLKKVAQLANMAKELGCTTAQLALAWCLKNPNVSTVITGASRKEQVTDNMQSLPVVEKLTPAVMDAIEEILQNKPRPEEDYR